MIRSLQWAACAPDTRVAEGNSGVAKTGTDRSKRKICAA